MKSHSGAGGDNTSERAESLKRARPPNPMMKANHYISHQHYSMMYQTVIGWF